MNRWQKIKYLFFLLIICLSLLLVVPSPKVMNWLGWTDEGIPMICIPMGFFGSVITFFVLLFAICGSDRKSDVEEETEI